MTQVPGDLLRHHRFGLLLAAILIYMLVLPLSLAFGWSIGTNPLVMRALFLILMVSAALAAVGGRSGRTVVIGLGIVSFAVGSVADFGTNVTTASVASVTNVAFMWMIIVIIIRFLFRHRRVDANCVAACLCAYLILGLIWANLYSMVEMQIPNSFSYPEGTMERVSNAGGRGIVGIYFSFVTLSTLGYGDIIPISTPARLLCASEAMIGQLFLAVVVARFVGLHVAHNGSALIDEAGGSKPKD